MNKLCLYATTPLLLSFLWTGIAICQTKGLDTAKIESELAKKRDLIAQEEQEQLDRAATDSQSMIDHVQQRADSDISEVPTFFYDSAGRRMPNQDYNSIVNSIQTEAQSRIKDISARLPKQQEMIRQSYQEKINGLAGSILNINSGLAPNKKGAQLVPAGSDLYVRNYSYGKEPSIKKQETNAKKSQ